MKPLRLLHRLVLLSLAVAGCRGAQPIPYRSTEQLAPAERVDVVLERAAAVKTLSGVVECAITSSRYDGALDIVCLYERPGNVHFSAYKGVLLSSYPIFDLTITADRYRLRLYDENGDFTEHDGAAEDFPRERPDMAALYWARKALYLPGDHVEGTARWANANDGEPRGEGDADAGDEGNVLMVDNADGARVSLRLDPRTSAVVAARIEPPAGDSLELGYGDWRRVDAPGNGATADGVVLPHRVTLRGGGADAFDLRGVVVDVEVNGEIDAEIFSLSREGRDDA